MKKLFKTVVVGILLAFLIIPNILAVGQGEDWDILINQVSPLETPDSMILKVYFTLFENHSGVPVMNAEFSGAQISLLNTNFIAGAKIQKPDIPIYISLLMDASGSMGGSANSLIEAAQLSLNNIPDDSLFSVVQFDENIKLLQDYTKNLSAISFAIDQYQPSNKGTCLYDAAYTAIESMSKLPTGRRAIILFTDGKDEKADGSICSQHKYQELIDLAMKSQVPINTIGLSTKEANINTVELQAMASSTGGFSSIASKDDLPAAFSRIMDALKAQWMVEGLIYPKNGPNNAVLTLTLKDGQTLNTAFTVESNTDYPGPPSPVTVRLNGLLLNAAKQAYEIQLDMTSAQLAEYVKVEVWDKQGGAKVGEYVFNNPMEANSFFIPTESLTIGKEYELRISAINKEDKTPFAIVRNDQGEPSTQLIHEFAFDPSSAYPSLQVLSIAAQKGDLVLNVSITNPDLIGGFDGWLVDEETNTQVPNSNFTNPPFSNVNGTITIPMTANRIPNGKYSVVVRVLAKNNNVFSTINYPGISYKAPSLFQRLGAALVANPIFLGGIVVIIVGVVGFLMFNASRQKTISGTPVLQGQLGEKLNKSRKPTDPVIPVADNEPIPMRQSPPAAPIPSVPTKEENPPASFPIESTLTSLPQNNEATMVMSSPVRYIPFLSGIQFPPNLASIGRIIISEFPYTIGRLEGNLKILEASISRRHAQITYNPTQQSYYLTDLNSSNGTFLNGQKLDPERSFLLSNGSMIGLGPHVTIRFDLEIDK